MSEKLSKNDRIDSLLERILKLETRIDNLLSIKNDSFHVDNIPTLPVNDYRDGSRPVTTTEYLHGNVISFPQLRGEIVMDGMGNITDDSWTRISEKGEEFYIQKNSIGEIVKKINTFDVDENRRKIKEYYEKRKNCNLVKGV